MVADIAIRDLFDLYFEHKSFDIKLYFGDEYKRYIHLYKKGVSAKQFNDQIEFIFDRELAIIEANMIVVPMTLRSLDRYKRLSRRFKARQSKVFPPFEILDVHIIDIRVSTSPIVTKIAATKMPKGVRLNKFIDDISDREIQHLYRQISSLGD